MNEIIGLGNTLGPAANLIAVFVAIVGAVRFITSTITRYRQSEREYMANAEAIGKRLRANISNADSQLGWHASMAYAEYYLNSTAQRVVCEQNKITHRLLLGSLLFGLLAWQALVTLSGIAFISTAVLILVDMYFLRRIERSYETAERELGRACAEQLDRIKVPHPEDQGVPKTANPRD